MAPSGAVLLAQDFDQLACDFYGVAVFIVQVDIDLFTHEGGRVLSVER